MLLSTAVLKRSVLRLALPPVTIVAVLDLPVQLRTEDAKERSGGSPYDQAEAGKDLVIIP